MLTQLTRTTHAVSEPKGQTNVEFEDLDCLVELRATDEGTGIQFRDCLVDYTACPNQNCIKKLL